MPNLFVITGANGAGKSTLASTLLPDGLSDLVVFDGDKFFVKALSDIFPSQMKSPKYARNMAFEATIAEFDKLVTEASETAIPAWVKLNLPEIHKKIISFLQE